MYKPKESDIENEGKVIALIIDKPSRYFLICNKINEDNFSHPDHQLLYTLISDVVNKNADQIEKISLYAHLNMEIRKMGGSDSLRNKLHELKNSFVYQLTDSIIPMAIEAIQVSTMKQKVSTLSMKLTRTISENGTSLSTLQDIVNDLNKAIILDSDASEPITMTEAGEALEEFHNSDYATVDTGLDNQNDLLGGGWSRLHYIILAARPGMGKTTVICFHSLSAALKGTSVAIFSLEETKISLYARICAYFCDSTYGEILNNTFESREQEKRYREAEAIVRKLPIFIYDTDNRSSDIADILNVATVWSKTRNIGLIFMDHIGLMHDRSVKAHDPRTKIESVSSKLRMWQKTNQLPLIVASQLSRAVESRQGNRPILSDLRDSGAIEQDAVGVLMLFREDYYLQRKHYEEGGSGKYIPNNQIEYIWGKYRNGNPEPYLYGCNVGHTKIYRIGSLKERNEPKPYIPPVLPIENSFGISTTMKAHNTEDNLPF